jgi:low affinity Fe/Cu permease
MTRKKTGFKERFEKISTSIRKAMGSSTVLLIALSIVAWGIIGSFFHFSDTWQLVINTGITNITFLMVLIIQQTQIKDSVAMQLKVNECIASNRVANKRLIVVKDLTGDEREVLKMFYINYRKLPKTKPVCTVRTQWRS